MQTKDDNWVARMKKNKHGISEEDFDELFRSHLNEDNNLRRTRGHEKKRLDDLLNSRLKTKSNTDDNVDEVSAIPAVQFLISEFYNISKYILFKYWSFL